MIGLRHLSNNRLELFASRFPLDTLKPYLLEYYRHAFATIVLYEDNIEVFHETGIYSFDASEPETFNYEEFRAELVEEFNDKVAVCTVENLFLHLQTLMEEKPLQDDPFHNLVFSISIEPPSREVLLDWEKNIDKRLRRVLYDDHAQEHFQLFPDEVCVVYSHDNYFTSITSDRENLIQAVFEDILEEQLTHVTRSPLSPEFVHALYHYTKTNGTIRLKTEKLQTDQTGKPFLLMTYPKYSSGKQKLISKIFVSDTGSPLSVSEPESIPRLKYHLQYSDLTLLPMVLTLSLMSIIVFMAFYFRILFHSASL